MSVRQYATDVAGHRTKTRTGEAKSVDGPAGIEHDVEMDGLVTVLFFFLFSSSASSSFPLFCWVVLVMGVPPFRPALRFSRVFSLAPLSRARAAGFVVVVLFPSSCSFLVPPSTQIKTGGQRG